MHLLHQFIFSSRRESRKFARINSILVSLTLNITSKVQFPFTIKALQNLINENEIPQNQPQTSLYWPYSYGMFGFRSRLVHSGNRSLPPASTNPVHGSLTADYCETIVAERCFYWCKVRSQYSVQDRISPFVWSDEGRQLKPYWSAVADCLVRAFRFEWNGEEKFCSGEENRLEENCNLTSQLLLKFGRGLFSLVMVRKLCISKNRLNKSYNWRISLKSEYRSFGRTG